MFHMKLLMIIIANIKLITCLQTNVDNIFKEAPTIRCNKRSFDTIERLLPTLFPPGTDQRVPETTVELKQYCNLYDKNKQFILGYFKSCTGQLSQTVAKIMLYNIAKQMELTCKAGKISKQARELMTAGKCANKAKLLIRECNTKLIDALLGAKKAPEKSRIYMTCCHSNAYRLCLREATEETKGCTSHTIDWAEKYVLKMLGSAINLICGQYFEESDKCLKLIKETPEPQIPLGKTKPTNFLLPMLDLMESISEVPNK
ncbi:uncharacterized protein LOC128953807 [Oppia nitens]|uniref:uncharacterized protein LOC128953807 n=1 Tax=Oppia nitens TaxID=1686743 RepID=UPI0023DB6D24|nr:uncharacterized protein LOC128953807 [Oppia nitens]